MNEHKLFAFQSIQPRQNFVKVRVAPLARIGHALALIPIGTLK